MQINGQIAATSERIKMFTSLPVQWAEKLSKHNLCSKLDTSDFPVKSSVQGLKLTIFKDHSNLCQRIQLSILHWTAISRAFLQSPKKSCFVLKLQQISWINPV